MIPKIIHYVWVGKKEKPNNIKEAITTWQKNLARHGYRIIEWNETNWDISKNKFAKESYEAGKYAYVSDVIRLDVLYRYGGIYLDADTIVKKSFSSLIKDKAFWGMMYNNAINAGIIGAEKGNLFIKFLLEMYDGFSYDMLAQGKIPNTNNEIITKALLRFYPDFKLTNKIQRLSDDTVIYPKEYFTYPTYCSKKDYAEQMFLKSWDVKKTSKFYQLNKNILQKLLGKVLFGKISSYRGAKRYRHLITFESDLRKNEY